MSSILEQYKSVYEQLKSVYTQYASVEKSTDDSAQRDRVQDALRIEHLQTQLKNIDEYSEKVEYFRQLSEKHLTSKNLLTITPRELNFNRLRNWAMMIDPTVDDDPYAQRIFVQARCNALFLRLKKEEFEKTIAELSLGNEDSDAERTKVVDTLKKQYVAACIAIVEGDEFAKFAQALQAAFDDYNDSGMLQSIAKEYPSNEASLGIGLFGEPLPILEEAKYIAKAKLGDFYYMQGNSVLLPVELLLNKETVVSVACSAGKEKQLYQGVQNMLLNIISRYPIGLFEINVLDALHFNNSVLGALRPLEGSPILGDIPKDAETLSNRLREIVSSFSDIDETIGMADSVHDFNQKESLKEWIPRKLFVLVGYPSAFSSESKEFVQRILLNYERYGISLILIDTQYAKSKDGGPKTESGDLTPGMLRIQMLPDRTLITTDGEALFPFKWFRLSQELSQSFVDAIQHCKIHADVQGSEYVKRVNMENPPAYVRGKKNIVLPYGIDQKDAVHSISFDNENFASYLMGASGSGKSTLLHTLITGILLHYHPDDVELWLADFKMSEFAQYINPLPPHVRYILLDESQELVFDLIDQLTEKMMERQRFFMRHRNLKKVENVPKEIYMPVIFVILDEFSIMSQAVSESETYKLKLQNLLAKGRALGIKFIFASQTFTKGVAGLTATAKEQIQARLAMKNSYDEIDRTLELSSAAKTEQVRNWMYALPPFYVLSKYREGDAIRVNRLKGLYFAGKGDEALAPQRALINHLNEWMQPIQESMFDPDQLDTYVDKRPVIIDGNSYSAFDPKYAASCFEHYRQAQADELTQDDILLLTGSPRRLERFIPIVLSAESRENLLLVTKPSECACSASIAVSAAESFLLQGGNVHIWAYHKDRVYRAYRQSHFKRYDIREGIDEICDAIRELTERVNAKTVANDLFILLGMDQICGDFEFYAKNHTGSSNVLPSAIAISSDVLPRNEEERLHAEALMRSQREFEEICDRIEDEGLEAGKSLEEIEHDIDAARVIYEARHADDRDETDPQAETAADTLLGLEAEAESVEDEVQKDGELTGGAYNATEDFKELMRRGSRLGYHFMLCLNSFVDLKATGVSVSLFRHRLAFQLSKDDSQNVFDSTRAASDLPDHVCQYSNLIDRFSFRPFLHAGIVWDGWEIDANGQAITGYVAE